MSSGVDAEGHLPMMITIYILAAIGAISVLVTAVIVLAALTVAAPGIMSHPGGFSTPGLPVRG